VNRIAPPCERRPTTPAPLSLALPPAPRSHRGAVVPSSYSARARAMSFAPVLSRKPMRSTDFCTPKHRTEHSCSSLPGAATARPTPFDAVRPLALVPRLAPRAHPRGVVPRAVRRTRRRDARAPRSPGPLDAGETGEGRVSRREPHCTPRRLVLPPGVILPGGEPCERGAGILVASFSPAPRGRCSRSVRELEGRQDRLRGGLVKGVRFLGRGCLPSPGRPRGCRPAPECKTVREALVDRSALT